jgi:glycosyltransferase involved in cell wall biosynthesis
MTSYVGRVSDECIEALYDDSSIVVFPSRYEGFSFPALEAMYHDTPVTCSDSSSIPVIAGEAAYYFNSGNAISLAESIRTVLSDDNLQKELFRAGQHD